MKKKPFTQNDIRIAYYRATGKRLNRFRVVENREGAYSLYIYSAHAEYLLKCMYDEASFEIEVSELYGEPF